MFLFDARYLGAALVSVASLVEVLGPASRPVTLAFLASGSAADAQAGQVLLRFQQGLAARHPQARLNIVSVQGQAFSDYVQRFHFSRTILYKAAMPVVFEACEHIVLMDCGMIFGQRIKDFLADLEQRIRERSMPVVGAFCMPPEGPDGALDAGLRGLPHHALYPSAAILYFDVRRYRDAAVYNRYLAAYAAHRERLVYAEQDLLCLVLREGELGAFEVGVDARCHIDLAAPAGWSQTARFEALHASGEHLYLKHVGSFKPWKKWVLHPAKAIYLRELRKLEALVGAEGLAALHDAEIYPAPVGYLEQQLALLERHYESSAGASAVRAGAAVL